MSIKIINLVWDTPCESHTQKLVLIALADNANDQRVCWPSLDYLAKRCDLTRQGVILQIKALTEKNLLRVRKDDGRVNVYELFPDQSTPLTCKPGLPVNPVDANPSTPLTTPVNAVDPNRKEPSVEPPREARAKFKPPTLDEAKAKAQELGLPESEAVKFHSYYESNGWRVGKNPMKKWSAAMVTWRSKWNESGGKTKTPAAGASAPKAGPDTEF